jgi:outer membrane protein TolC
MYAMRAKLTGWMVVTFALSLNFAICRSLDGQTLGVFPEQRAICVRSPEALLSIPLPAVDTPFTVAAKEETRQEQPLSLDEAIQIAIQNSEVVRVLTGISATASGSTIYDVAIASTAIDAQNAVFDPAIDVTSVYGKDDPAGASSSTDSFNTSVNLSKQTIQGATAGVNINAIGSYFEPGVFPLDPEYRSTVELSLRQPFLQGFGRAANLAPVVIARIDTERSFFQFKDSVQELVRGVIAAYWNLVSARVDVWARKQQVEQSQFAYDRALARKEQGLARAADVAQAGSALASFKAALITARSNELLAETALRNIMNLPPSSTSFFVPTSEPVLEKIEFDWNRVISVGEVYRPDLIELKLILEADQQLLIQANNQARPQLDGIANYRWNGLSGELPNGAFMPNEPGRYAGFNVGVNFSVPLGLRQGRANLRRQELLIMRDQANLQQGMHQMIHDLAINYRNLDQFFEQYIAFKEAREAARLNYENQVGEAISGRAEFLNVLQAITDWGNSVSQEASSITQYNTELANVERQTGTILETHGIRFVEERFGSLGPRGLGGIRRSLECYPADTRPEGLIDKYEESDKSSDASFNLEDLSIDFESLRGQAPSSRKPEPQTPEPSRPNFQPPPPDAGRIEPADSEGNRFSERVKRLFHMR